MTLENLEDWPNCAIEGCPNKACLALDSHLCFPHTPGTSEEKHRRIDAELERLAAREGRK